VTILQARAEAGAGVRPQLDGEVDGWIGGSGRIGRAPAPELRERIELHLPDLDRRRRRQIEFVLRTSV
jgi:hypothetical protein